jgi:hypothetical protein
LDVLTPEPLENSKTSPTQDNEADSMDIPVINWHKDSYGKLSAAIHLSSLIMTIWDRMDLYCHAVRPNPHEVW